MCCKKNRINPRAADFHQGQYTSDGTNTAIYAIPTRRGCCGSRRRRHQQRRGGLIAMVIGLVREHQAAKQGRITAGGMNDPRAHAPQQQMGRIVHDGLEGTAKEKTEDAEDEVDGHSMAPPAYEAAVRSG
ncbi:Uu.00g113390.m01.CDS01 [Anthostomella pinea]|uniref:Uu.00g113390.m01.CDS01 n=1 Tax=Anthostomella pinea TaxID=933095 RepID=A0AAI8YGG1_9PEZI|nr:Uu.00g113390.m01.CDS01 [Anthostomella pinea]